MGEETWRRRLVRPWRTGQKTWETGLVTRRRTLETSSWTSSDSVKDGARRRATASWCRMAFSSETYENSCGTTTSESSKHIPSFSLGGGEVEFFRDRLNPERQ